MTASRIVLRAAGTSAGGGAYLAPETCNAMHYAHEEDWPRELVLAQTRGRAVVAFHMPSRHTQPIAGARRQGLCLTLLVHSRARARRFAGESC